VLDFSNHAATGELLDYCEQRRLPVVLATTGQTPEELARIGRAAGTVPVFRSANMSLGIAVLLDLARRAARMFPDADVEIVEAHHNQKLDVPSGTALMLANAVRSVRPEAEFVVGRHENGKRKKSEIGIHSLRLGNEVGMHEILITTGNETLTLKHEAESRALFAEGALAAAAWLMGKPAGLYNMQDLLEESL
jgi:4-hydroxy-tetrahydrodipicolinate reductase